MADLSVLVIAKGCMPFQAASTMANCSILQRKGQYPKIERIMNDCLAYPAVANFVKNSEHKTFEKMVKKFQQKYIFWWKNENV
jgi:hypothetical protein